MRGNSELMGVLPEHDRSCVPQPCSAARVTAKVQDEIGHAQLDLPGRRRSRKAARAVFNDLISVASKFHNVFHYPSKTWGDIGMIAWLVDAAAIISPKALLKCSSPRTPGSWRRSARRSPSTSCLAATSS